jgi:hypothetical protein
MITKMKTVMGVIIRIPEWITPPVPGIDIKNMSFFQFLPFPASEFIYIPI